jgi:hypothetical protein
MYDNFESVELSPRRVYRRRQAHYFRFFRLYSAVHVQESLILAIVFCFTTWARRRFHKAAVAIEEFLKSRYSEQNVAPAKPQMRFAGKCLAYCVGVVLRFHIMIS